MLYLARLDCQLLKDHMYVISGYSGSTGMDALPGLDGLSAAKGSCMSFQIILGLQVWMVYLAWMDGLADAKGLYVCGFRSSRVYRSGWSTWLDGLPGLNRSIGRH